MRIHSETTQPRSPRLQQPITQALLTERYFFTLKAHQMIFTSRTYRKAIRRSVQMEQIKRGWVNETEDPQLKKTWEQDLNTQINHTRRLQARKRKERK